MPVQTVTGSISLDRLGRTDSISIADDVLVMFDSNGDVLLEFDTDGKVAAAQEPLLLSMGKRSLEELKAFLAASPKLVPTAALSQPTAGSQVVVMLTEEQKHYAEQMGIPEKDMAEFIAKQKASASK